MIGLFNGMLDVAIADGDQTFLDLFGSYVSNTKNWNLLAAVSSGEQVLPLLRRKKPAVLIMDIVLPGIDGFGVLKAIQNEQMIKPVIIIASAMGRDFYTRTAMELGADYYILKPLDFGILLERARELAQKAYNKNIGAYPFDPQNSLIREDGGLRQDVTRLLHDIGIPAHLSGYQYLRDAVCMVIEEPALLYKMTKQVYPVLADKNGKSPASVEKAIRTAIEIAWMRGKTDLLDELFGFTVNSQKGKPTNTEFIAMLADRFHINDHAVY